MRKGAVHSSPVDSPPIAAMLNAAREGARHAFLTEPGRTRYGASVWTASGRIHGCGQYSSFNHSTNVHAEMGALAVAAAAGDPDVLALVVVSTSATDGPARPCGVCRQVIAEHGRRVGRVIDVYMASWDGRVVERMSIDELLPCAWDMPKSSRQLPWVEPDPPTEIATSLGDHLIVGSRYACLVWGHDTASGLSWVKVKYDASRKLPHSYTEWDAYQAELSALGLGERTACGDIVVLADPTRCPRIPRVPISHVGIGVLRPLLDLLPSHAMVTGSHALGMARGDSDIDIVVDQSLDDETCDRLCAAILDGSHLGPPVGSSTWSRMSGQHDDALDLVRARRFCDTFSVRGRRGDVRVSMIWSPRPQVAAPLKTLQRGRQTLPLSGRVGAVHVRGKPTMWRLDTSESRLEVETWHKDGGLLRSGDTVTVSGLQIADARGPLVQVSPDRDFIRIEDMA